MNDDNLSNLQREKGRRLYQGFQVFNVFSFTMLSGSVLTLFSLRLGADNFFIGVIASLSYLSLLFMVLGRGLIKKLGVRRQFAVGWILRNVCILPMTFTPLLSAAGKTTAALLIIFLSLLGFNLFKGLGLVSMNPIVGALSEGRDRGEFLTRLQINVHVVLILTNLFIGVFLKGEVPLGRYVFLISLGITAGLFSTIFIFRLPAFEGDGDKSGMSLFAGMVDGFKRTDFRSFMVFALLAGMVMGMANPFLVVFAKKGYGLSDSNVMFFLVAGNAGAILMGLAARVLINRLGPKPLYLMFLAIQGVSLVPIFVAPGFSAPWLYVYLAVVFFLYNFGAVGGANSAQTYFFTITNASEHLNLGIVYNVINGIAGTVGSLLGGALLGGLERTFPEGMAVFRSFYGLIFILLLVCIYLEFRLKDTGQYSIRNALEIILSRKDMKAVALLHKLDTTSTELEEVRIIDSLAELDSSVPLGDLLARLKSPKLTVRSRVLLALESLPADERVGEALIAEVENHAFTTAHMAARIIGRKSIREGIPILRKSLGSDDYLLQGETILALARLGDAESIRMIESILLTTQIPRVLIFSASALELFKDVRSVEILLKALNKENPPTYVRDEIILSIAGILGMHGWFYGMYTTFLENGPSGVTELVGYLIDHRGKRSESIDKLRKTVRVLLKDREAFGRRANDHFSQLYDARRDNVCKWFADAAADPNLLRFDRFRFLMAAVLIELTQTDQGVEGRTSLT